MRGLALLTAWLALAPPGVGLAAEFEDAPSEPCTVGLPPAQCADDDFRIDEPVPSDGLMRHYLVVSRFGRFEAYGQAGVEARLREVAALARLQKTNDVSVVADAVGDRVTGGAKTLAGVATHPLDTVTGIPRGIAHLFQGYAAQARELGEQAGSVNGPRADGTAAGGTAGVVADARRYAARYLGVSTSERSWYRRLGVDPYTDNELLRRAVHRYARVDATAKFGLKFAPLPGLPYAGEAQRALDAIYGEDPAVLRARRRTTLAGYGLSPAEIRRFDNTLALNPTRQERLVAAAAALAGVAGRGELFRHAMALESDHEAEAFVRSAALLAEVHAREPLAAVLPGVRLPAARTVAGQVVVAGAFDAVAWTEEVERFEQATHAAVGDGPGNALWLRRAPSPRAAAELAARGWTVRVLEPGPAAAPRSATGGPAAGQPGRVAGRARSSQPSSSA